MTHNAKKLRNWLSDQISNYLTTRQGCVQLVSEESTDTTKMIVQDVFGQCYEVTVKALTNTMEGQENDYEGVLKRNFVGLSQNKNFI